MKRVHRRVLLFSATVIFLGLAPLVIFYAMGYRPGATTADPVPVGVILVESFPRRADVTLRGTVLGRTPRAIPNVPAGTAHLEVDKPGYVTWAKSIPVRPGLVSEVRGVRLFPTEKTPQSVTTEITDFTASPNGKLVAAVDNQQRLSVFDQEQSPVVSALPLRERVARLLWSPTTTGLLLQNRSGAVDYFDVATPTVRPRRIAALASAKEIAWDQRIPSRLLFLTPTGIVRAYNVATSAGATITSGATTFAASSRQMYVATRAGTLEVFTIQGQRVRTIPLPPDTTVAQILVHDRGSLAVITSDNVLLVWQEDEFVTVSSAVALATWSPDGTVLLVQPEANALYAYNVADERSPLPLNSLQLIIRLSRPITHTRWFAGGQHVVYQVDDEIHITETDTRDYPVSYQADTTNRGNANVVVGDEGKALWYLKQNEGVAELTFLPLVVEEDL